MSKICNSLKAKAGAFYPKDTVRLHERSSSSDAGRHACDGLPGALYNLIACFDGFCSRVGISYFARGDLLACVLSYARLHPAVDLEGCSIGMLREEFERLKGAVGECGPKGFHIVAGGFVPSLVSTTDARVALRIDVFDAVTEDFDLALFQKYELKYLMRRGATPSNVRRAVRIAGRYNGKGERLAAALLSGDFDPVPLEDISSVEPIPFGAGSIPVAVGTLLRIVEAKEANPLKAKREALLSIAQTVDDACRRAGIGYFACGGTLLGCVREGGFLPWDDDLDIAMLRDDYERFLELAPQMLPENMLLQTRATSPNIPYVYSKVRLSGTHDPTPYTAVHDMEDGISIDIFPFDKIPAQNIDESLSYVKQALELDASVRRIAGARIRPGLPRRATKTPAEFIGRQLVLWRRAIIGGQPIEKAQAGFDAHITKYKGRSDIGFVSSCIPTFTCAALDELLPYGRAPFDGIELSVPADPVAFLKMQFGDDFMTPPPPHLRVGHTTPHLRTIEG